MQNPQLPIASKSAEVAKHPIGTPVPSMKAPTKSAEPVMPVPISRSQSLPVSQISRQQVTSSGAKLSTGARKQIKRPRWSNEEDMKLHKYLSKSTLPIGIEKEFPGRKRTSILVRFNKLKKEVWSKLTRVHEEPIYLYEPKTKRTRDDLDETIDDDSGRMTKTVRFGENPDTFITKAQPRNYVNELAKKNLEIAKLTKMLNNLVKRCDKNYKAYITVKNENYKLKSSMILIHKLSSVGNL
jgi:hypothetical protein